MIWEIRFAKQASAFLDSNHIPEEYAVRLIRETIRKFQGETVSVDIRKMKGKWAGYYRIRKRKWRMIIAFDFDARSAFAEAIDWRGNIY